jgi:hypothetical protein
MKGLFIRSAWVIVCSILTIMGAGWGIKYDWPDFVHVDYGFPVKWATHTLITFTGPSDRWMVEPTMLLIDIAIWQTILIIGIIVLELKIFKK